MTLFTFFNPCVLRAHGGSGYTFGALAILEGCHPGKNPDVHSKSRSVPIAAIRLPPGSTAVTLGAGPTPWGLCQEAGGGQQGPEKPRGWLPSGGGLGR